MRVVAVVALWSSLAQSKYVWPAKTDFLEDMLAIQDGTFRFGFTDLVVPCGFGSNEPGKQTSAEWIRTVFHDTITHDKAKGTGGLDASIMFETERAENEGAAFNNTLGELHEFVSPRSSGSDLLALGLVAAVGSCGGQRVPLRMGRIDATKPGPSGVPKPDQNLKSSMAAFTKAGFSQKEMIALVACGHTVGGVHSKNFPQITGGKPSDTNKPTFDRTSDSFDNAVVKEYLTGKGVNPLVFGRNQTTNSDKRIFGSDGNATMTQLNDPNTFQKTCAMVFERLIDTVPSSVKLSEPIELVDVKPYIDKLEPTGTSRLAFEGRIRVRTSKSTGRDASTLRVFLNTLDRKGKRTRLEATGVRIKGGQSFGFFEEVFTWYEFATQVDAVAGLKAFDVQLKSGSSKEVVIDNQGTGGFPVQDGLVYVKSKSCLTSTAVEGNFTLTVEAAVRKDLVTSYNAPVVQMAHKISQPGAILPRLSIQPALMAVSKGSSNSGNYAHYVAKIPISAKESSTSFDIQLQTKSGLVLSEFHRTNDVEPC
ncbi:heme peroxidase [Thelonectria olida]|uniref:Peroxidase n=1 Tax=Thelonectria olida TaxID=1576542 RepID=A0A9P8W0C5_9HYPO|nr:heme peroxidase [Thelonectria olida]